MKKNAAMIMILLFAALCGAAQASGTLQKVRERGVLLAGVKDSTPGFGSVDERTGQIVGYDVDFVSAIARKLGVKLQLKPVTSANRMQHLMEGNIDIIAATMTATPERAQQIDFSLTYFFTGQRFLVRRGTVASLDDFKGKSIGTAKGSTSMQNLERVLPNAAVIPFDDYGQAFLSLQADRIFAVTTDEAILANLLSNTPDRDRFEIPDIRISDEPYGLGIRKGDKNFLDFVNGTLLEMEKSGEAEKIFDRWFGPRAGATLKRGSFKIREGGRITEKKRSPDITVVQ